MDLRFLSDSDFHVRSCHQFTFVNFQALGCEPSTSTAYCGFPGTMQRNFTSMPGMMPPFAFNPAAAGAANPYLAMFPGAPFGFMPPHSAAFGMLPPGMWQLVMFYPISILHHHSR